MKNILLVALLSIFAFANEFKFEKVTLDDMELQGLSSEIKFESKNIRDIKMAQVWAKLMKKNNYNIVSEDNKIYAIYTNQKKDSFNYFVGFKSKVKNKDLETITLKEAKYQNTVVDFSEESNMSDIWDEITKEKVKRDFKTDIEVYNIKDISKKSYKVDVYLSSN